MGRHGPYYCAWTDLLLHHLRARKLSATDFAKLVGESQQRIQSYTTGMVKPPLPLVPRWAAVLGLKNQQREDFVWFALEPWTPPQVWHRLRQLQDGLVPPAPHPSEQQLAERLHEREETLREMRALLLDIRDAVWRVPTGAEQTLTVEQRYARREKLRHKLDSVIEKTNGLL